MRVAVIFDMAFAGEAADAVWIVDTPANREWFASKRSKIDSNSAMFSIEGYLTVELAAVQMVWNAEDHHPEWDDIAVIGVQLTPNIKADLQLDVCAVSTEAGFTLHRTKAC